MTTKYFEEMNDKEYLKFSSQVENIIDKNSTLEYWKNVINQHGYFLVAEDLISKQNLAYITMRTIPNKRIINLSFRVARDFIGKGIGSVIFSDLINELLVGFKYEEIHAGTREENTSMNRLLLKNNFQLIEKENLILFKSNKDFKFNYYKIEKNL
jgi:RimJ/RimL family protein N-acetyltransferase